jgi:hypothetical protein
MPRGYPVESGWTHAESRELFRLRNADAVQVFSLRELNAGLMEVTILHLRRNRLERTELAGTFANIAAAIEFVKARQALLSSAGWKRV